ncbi:MAG TPA: translocation/assembly module TamB domain-containing protein, partial [Chitinophagaceae bacterium]|nr:translocation/assembly module TamB domain-containing protein [Chitinophagaceae bacterium]
KKIIEANSLNINGPIVALRNYTGRKVNKINTESIKVPTVDSLLQWNKEGWAMHVADLKIKDGTFKTDKEDSLSVLASFDGRHIDFNQINGEFTNVRWDKDTISTHLKLQTKERSGFEIKNMLADVKFSPEAMAFNNLDIHTNNSVIKNFFSMSYADFNDMNDFIHKIKMTGDFEGSEIESDDIAFFAPELKTWKKKISLKGKVRGTLDDLVGKDLIIQAGKNTLLNGDITLTGLPDINQTFIDFKADDFRTNYRDAVTVVTQLKEVNNPDLKKIQYVHFTGSFTGFIRDFVTFGSFETNLGTVKCDLNMKLPLKQEPVYSGNISTDSFQLGEFVNNPQTGVISMSGVIRGSGLDENARNMNFDGKINFIDYNDYRYSNITINGTLDKKLFDGIASIDDPNAEISMNGKIDFNGKYPVFDLSADVKKAYLRRLNLIKDSISFKGKLNLNFTGDNLDNFNGIARITKATLSRKGVRLPFDSLVISSTIVNGLKTLTANSNEFDGTISGNFNIKDLPDAFKHFLNKYYPSFIKAPLIPLANESFTFDITTRNVDEFINLIEKDLRGFDYSHFNGRVDLSDNHFDLDANVPNFSYKQYSFSNAELKGVGTTSKFSLYGKTGNTVLNDSLNLPLTVFQIDAANDSSQVSISTGSNIALNKANLNAMVQVYDGGLRIRFDTSSFALNGKTWSIAKNGILEFGKNSMAQGELLLHESEQEIKLSTEKSATGNWNDLNIALKKVNIGDLSPFIMPQNRLEGLASGSIKVEDPYNKFNVKADIQTEQIRLDNDSLGSMNAHVEYDNIKKELTGNGKNLDPEHKIDYNFHLFFKDSLAAKNNRVTARTENYPIKFLQRFLGSLFSDVQGYITGPVEMTGPLDELNFTGKAKLHDGGVKVNFTQCFYKINDTTINLTPDEINLDGLVLTDPVTGNHVYMNGSIQHHSFKNMFYDLYISTRKPNTTGEQYNKPVLLLNTTLKDNNQFFGKIKGTGSLSLLGPQSEMYMKIDAIASSRDSGYITIPPSRSKESGIADFLVEKKYGREMSNTSSQANASNIQYDVDVTANTMVNFRMILDELTGDEIKGRGRGDLNIKAGSTEPLSLNGGFEIEDGSYLFTFQSFFKKPFEIKKGGNNFIKWSGDPYKAKINFDATYKAERVSFAPLANSLQLDPNLAKARGDVYVVASLTNDLFKPDIKFSLDFPASSPAVTDPVFSFNIQQMEKNINEINKQVTYLIVFNSFAPSELGTAGTGPSLNFSEIDTNTISGIFLGVINNEFNKILSKILKNDKYRVNFSSSVYNQNLIDPNNKTALNLGSNVNFSIGRSFFNNRFNISFGGGFEAPLQQTSIQQNIQLLPDVTMEWLINQSGTIRASFFYRENTDYLSTTTTGGPARARRTGASLAYRNESDYFLFGKKKRKQIQAEKQEEKKEEEKKIKKEKQ